MTSIVFVAKTLPIRRITANILNFSSWSLAAWAASNSPGFQDENEYKQTIEIGLDFGTAHSGFRRTIVK